MSVLTSRQGINPNSHWDAIQIRSLSLARTPVVGACEPRPSVIVLGYIEPRQLNAGDATLSFPTGNGQFGAVGGQIAFTIARPNPAPADSGEHALSALTKHSNTRAEHRRVCQRRCRKLLALR